MATTSVVQACLDKFAALTAANFPNSTLPTMYFDGPPEIVNGSQVVPPYVSMLDMGLTPVFVFEYLPVETTNIRFEVYYDRLGDVDMAIDAIKYNGGPVQAVGPPLNTPMLGFDFGTLPTLATNYTQLEIVRTNERRFKAGRGAQSQRTHCCWLDYTIKLQRSS